VPLKSTIINAAPRAYQLNLSRAIRKKTSSRKLQIASCLGVRLRRMLGLAGVKVGAIVEVGDEADLGWAPA
jgi:hypothetical protein